MTLLLIVLTLLCLAVPVYVYAGYPAALWALSRLFGRTSPGREGWTPSVTLVISCYNEVDVIRGKLENTLSLDYPKEKLIVLVVSDGSDDGTDDIVKAYSGRGIRLIRQEGRLGKTMGLNLAMEHADSEIVVFSDANAMYERSAVRHLVSRFGSERVGYVVGSALYTDGHENASAGTENLYWRYELAIKQWESDLHSVVGGDGAIYAIRRHLWEPLQQRDINDFVNPLQIVAKGYRGLFEPKARCYEETTGNFEKEGLRKRRIVNRSVRGLMRVRQVMNPLKYGWFAWEVISHKLLRWFIPLFLLVALIGSILLTLGGVAIFSLVVLGAALILGLAAFGAFMNRKSTWSPLMSAAFYFVLINANALLGLISAMMGKTQVVWSSARPSATVSHARQANRLGVVYLAIAGTLVAISLFGFRF